MSDQKSGSANAPSYYRARDGKAVHRAGCRLAVPELRWVLVDGYDPESVLKRMAGFPWLRPCKRCWPAPLRNAGGFE